MRPTATVPEAYGPMKTIASDPEVLVLDRRENLYAKAFSGHDAEVIAWGKGAFELIGEAVERLAVLNSEQRPHSAAVFATMAGEIFKRAGQPEAEQFRVERIGTQYAVRQQDGSEYARTMTAESAHEVARASEAVAFLGVTAQVIKNARPEDGHRVVTRFLEEGRNMLADLKTAVALEQRLAQAGPGEPRDAGVAKVLAAAVEIAAMKEPSLEKILRRQGYIYEARKIAELVSAVEQMEPAPRVAAPETQETNVKPRIKV